MSALAHFADSSRTSPEVREVPAFRTSRCDKAERSFDLHFLDADFLFWTAIYGFVLWDRIRACLMSLMAWTRPRRLALELR
jgi:hypothetical protein